MPMILPTIRIAAVDDQPIVLHGIGSVLEQPGIGIQLLAIATSVDELLAGPGADADVVLLDLNMARTDGAVRNTERLTARGIRVLLFTSEERPVPIRQAIAAGAQGLVLKIDPIPTIAQAIEDVFAGRTACSGTFAQALLDDTHAVARLSPRGVEILRAISEGLPYKTVARRLSIAEATVREHINRSVLAYRDLGIETGNSHGLVSRARQDGYLEG
ncbi:MAG: response regulator transcription factor [Aeromicrobium sp.]